MRTLDKIMGKIERFVEDLYMRSVYEKNNKKNIDISEKDCNIFLYPKK